MKAIRNSVVAAVAVAALVVPAPRAFAVNRDMVQLQTQVQQLQDAVARLQQSNDERMGVLKDLVQQTADSVNKMTLSMNELNTRVNASLEANSGKTEQVSGQVQSLNDSVDELKARLDRMEKLLQTMQTQMQNSAANTAAAPAGGPGSTVATDGTAPGPAMQPADAASAQPSAPSLKDLYQTAYRDYMGGKNQLASAEFQDVTNFYSSDTLAGNAYFYMGEISYKDGKFSQAAQQYDKVLEGYPGNVKVPAAQLHKGYALIAMKNKEAGVRELHSLIQRFPNSPEASQARSRLSAMGVGRR